MSKFTHLHLHTNYSLLDGAIKIHELARYLKENEMKSCAITDHGSMFGVVKFTKEMKKAGIKPIIGCEAYTTMGSRFEKSNEIFHLVLLCQNKEGYKNLARMLTLAQTEGFYYKPRVDREILEKYSEGLIALSACLKGEIPWLIKNGREGEAKERAKWYSQVFKDRFYLEMQDNGIEEQYLVNEKLVQFSMELGIPLVATNDCHYIKKQDAFVQDILLCISTKKTLDDEKRMKMSTDEFYVKTAEEMTGNYFKEYPEAINNTLKIADQCDCHIENKNYFLPVMGKTEKDSSDVIDKLSREGLALKQIPAGQETIYEERLNYELSVIKKMGYSSYYLIVADFINWAKEQGIPVGPGRGSGVASLVAYALGIISMDPIKYDLIFERFLNPERTSLPDFDVDICPRRREEIFGYLVQKYGADRVTKIATFGFLKAKMAIKDVGRVLNYSVQEAQNISDLVPRMIKDEDTLRDLVNKEPELRKAVNSDPRIKKLVELAAAVEGSTRSFGIHAGGVVISSVPLTDVVPLVLAKDDVIATQFDMEDLETVGLIKFDILGLETLTIIDDAIKHIKKFSNPDFDLEKIPLDDAKIFEMLSRGDTIGIFQLESDGMQKLLRDLRPDRFEEIIAVNALFRPGPLEGGMVDQFINRKHGREEVDYPFQELEGILKETYGIIVYQEQVQRIASTLGGYTLGEADILRRAMGKKDPAKMAEQREIFIAGAKNKGHDAAKAGDLFDLMAKFAEYGFNKAHAAVYALNAYRTAYLKCYYPAEYLSAFLTAKMDKDIEESGMYIADAMAHGIKILSPDVNESMYDFQPRGESIRFGFGGIKNIGSAAIDNILEERGQKGLFKGFVDFCYRVDSRKVNRKSLEHLIKGGAFDSFGIDRGILFNNLDKIMNHATCERQDMEVGQCNLFGGGAGAKEEHRNNDDIIDKRVPVWDTTAKLGFEKEAIGFYISDHPMERFETALRASGVPDIFSIQHIPPDNIITAAGVINMVREIKTTGGIMAIFSLEDRTGSIEIVAYSDSYKQVQRQGLTYPALVVCQGKISDSSNKKKIMLDRVKPIDEGDFSFKIKVRGDKIGKKELNDIAASITRRTTGVSLDMEIVYPNEGSVILNIGHTSINECNKATGQLKAYIKEVNSKWSLDY